MKVSGLQLFQMDFDQSFKSTMILLISNYASFADYGDEKLIKLCDLEELKIYAALVDEYSYYSD